MSIIKLSNGFQRLPEGTHILKITAVEYNAATGKLTVTMQNREGITHNERYSLKKSAKEANEPAMAAFSYLARMAMNDDSLAEIDPENLVGHFLECDVEWESYEKKEGGIGTAVRLKDKRPSNGWDETPAAVEPPRTASGEIDLNALFNM